VRPLAFLLQHLTSSDPVGRATGASAHGPVLLAHQQGREYSATSPRALLERAGCTICIFGLNHLGIHHQTRDHQNINMPLPKFAIAAPGSAASQRISKLEKENAQLREELESLRQELREARGDTAPSRELPPDVPVPYHGHYRQRGKTHPVAMLSELKCSFPACGQYGHTENNCQLRVKNDMEKIATECQNGWHKPHLHDSMCKWRCQWCRIHLHEDYVQCMYPTEFIRERAKEAANHRKIVRKYTTRACNFQ